MQYNGDILPTLFPDSYFFEKNSLRSFRFLFFGGCEIEHLQNNNPPPPLSNIQNTPTAVHWHGMVKTNNYEAILQPVFRCCVYLESSLNMFFNELLNESILVMVLPLPRSAQFLGTSFHNLRPQHMVEQRCEMQEDFMMQSLQSARRFYDAKFKKILWC